VKHVEPSLCGNILFIYKNRFDRVAVDLASVGYLTTLLLSRLYSVDDRMGNECREFDGMTVDKGNRLTRE
jgi:hypothetical protein